MTDPGPQPLKLTVVFCVIATVVYGWSLTGGFLNWDDPTYVVDNVELRDASGLGSIFTTFLFANYNPIHRLSYWVEWQLVSDSAWLFRLTNVLLHAGNAVLLYELLRTWLGRPGVAVIAAALFLVHPSNVETVAWISERKSLLATAFALASTLTWLHGRRGWSLALFVLGMLSKTSVAPLPVLLLVIDLARKADWRRQLGWYVAFLVPAIVLGIVQIIAVDAVGAVRSPHGGTLVSHVATMVAVLPYYAFHLVLPFWLTPRHTFDPASIGDPRFWAGLAAVAAIGFGIVRSWRGERRFAVAATWALSALLVTLIVPIPIVLADRYWYFAMPLLLGVTVDWASRLAMGTKPQWRFAGVALVIAFTGAAFDYARMWRSSVALWSHAITRVPDDIDAWISLGAAYNEAQDMRSATLAYQQALELSPTNVEAIESMANVEVQIGRYEGARIRLEALLARQPDRVHARLMLAACFDLSGDTARASREFRDLLSRHGRNEEARRAISTFVERHPELAAKLRLPELRGAVPGR